MRIVSFLTGVKTPPDRIAVFLALQCRFISVSAVDKSHLSVWSVAALHRRSDPEVFRSAMVLPTGLHPVLSPFFCSHRTLFSALPGSHGAWRQAEFRRSAPPRSSRLDHRFHSPLEPYCCSATSHPSHRWKGRQSRPGGAHSLHGSATAAVSVFHLFLQIPWPGAMAHSVTGHSFRKPSIREVSSRSSPNVSPLSWLPNETSL